MTLGIHSNRLILRSRDLDIIHITQVRKYLKIMQSFLLPCKFYPIEMQSVVLSLSQTPPDNVNERLNDKHSSLFVRFCPLIRCVPVISFGLRSVH